MRRRVLGLAIASLLTALGARAGADEPVTCTCETDVVCPQVVCPAPQYAPPQYAPPQYAPPQYAPPPEPLMPYAPELAPPPATVAPPAPPPRALTSPPASKYDYREVTRPRWGMFGGGAGLFALSWGVPAIMGASVGYAKLAIPFAGPILLVTENPHAANCRDCTLLPLVPYVVIDVLAQLTGAIVAVAGLLTTEKVYVYSPKLTLAPTVTPNFVGLAAGGRF